MKSSITGVTTVLFQNTIHIDVEEAIVEIVLLTESTNEKKRKKKRKEVNL